MEWRETWQSVIIPNRTNHQQIKAIKTLHRSRFLFLKTPQTHQHCGANGFKTKCDGNVIIKHAQDISADEKVRQEQILSARKGSPRKQKLDSISVRPVLLAFCDPSRFTNLGKENLFALICERNLKQFCGFCVQGGRKRRVTNFA